MSLAKSKTHGPANAADRDHRQRLYRWFGLCFLISCVVPFGFKIMGLLFFSKEVTLGILFGKGDLFLVTCAIGMETVGELFGSGAKSRTESRWIFVLISCFISALVASCGYGLASVGALLPKELVTINEGLINWISILLFFVTCISAGYTRLFVST